MSTATHVANDETDANDKKMRKHNIGNSIGPSTCGVSSVVVPIAEPHLSKPSQPVFAPSQVAGFQLKHIIFTCVVPAVPRNSRTLWPHGV